MSAIFVGLGVKLEQQCTSRVSMLHISSAMTVGCVEGAASNDLFDADYG
jgi:hypothetical protein